MYNKYAVASYSLELLSGVGLNSFERSWLLCTLSTVFSRNCNCLFKVMKTKSRGGQPLLVGGQSIAYVSPFNTARQLCSSCKLPCKKKNKTENHYHIS